MLRIADRVTAAAKQRPDSLHRYRDHDRPDGPNGAATT
jgi:hypothetical protein